MYHCEECDRFWDEDDERIKIHRDGDPYDSRTKFWATCPFCNLEMEEFENSNMSIYYMEE